MISDLFNVTDLELECAWPKVYAISPSGQEIICDDKKRKQELKPFVDSGLKRNSDKVNKRRDFEPD